MRLIFGQTIDCKTVRIFAYSSTLYARTFKQKLKTESEDWGETLRARKARTLLSSNPILRKKTQLFCSLVKQANHCSEFPNAQLPYDQLQKQTSSNKTYLYISLMFSVICGEILGLRRVQDELSF